MSISRRIGVWAKENNVVTAIAIIVAAVLAALVPLWCASRGDDSQTAPAEPATTAVPPSEGSAVHAADPVESEKASTTTAAPQESEDGRTTTTSASIEGGTRDEPDVAVDGQTIESDQSGTEPESGSQLTTDSDIAAPVLWPSWNGETWVVLSWLPEENDPVGDAGKPESFEIRYRLNRDSEWSASPSSKTSYHDGSRVDVYQYYHRIENLIRLEDYAAQVRECTGDACSEWADHSFRTEKPVPPAPDEVRVVDVGTDFFVLEWDPVPGAYNYGVNYRGGGSITASGANEARYETTFDLDPGTRYTVTINSCNDLQRHGGYGEEACGPLTAGTTIIVTTLE